MCFVTTALLLAAVPVQAAAPVDLAAARASLAGAWAGTLEYRDYTADKWFGIPVKTRVEDQGDGVTVIRKSDFDDGPKAGNVRITSVELFDAAKNSVAVGTFRKGRTAEIYTYTARLAADPRDATHWTMVEETKGEDDNRPATLRLTTVRDGNALETLKEVDFLDDQKSEWLVLNRTRMTRTGD
jgi:hypothetical protein